MFTIVPNGHESLLGDKASEDLRLVKRIYQINTDNMNMIKQGKRLDHQQYEGSTDLVNKFPCVQRTWDIILHLQNTAQG